MMVDFEQFKNPPKSARPMVRWWWTGTDVEKDELLREVAELDEAGFLGAEIQAFMVGSPPNLNEVDPKRHRRSHRFMQPYYYKALKAVLDEGARRDMVFDLTVCSGWPAGGVLVAKEDSMKVLLMGTKVLKGGRRYVGPVPRFKKPFFYTLIEIIQCLGLLKGLLTFYRNEMRLIRVVAAKPIGKPGRVRSFCPKTAYLDIESAVDLSDKVDATGNLEWDVPQGTWQVFAFYAGPSGAQPSMDSRLDPEAKSLVLDHLAREPIEKHLEHHLGRGWPYLGEHLGRTLRAFFTDSLELVAEWIWTDDFLSEFQRRRGYNLALYLPVNYVPSRDNKFLSVLLPNEKPRFDFEGDLGQRIRHDFEQTVSDLFTERFAQAMTDWANANNLQSRIQAYGVRTDTLKTYGVAHIPETEQLFAGGMLDFLRLAGSAGLIYDKPLVTAEAMVWNQRDYLTTPLKWKVAADRLFVAGINQMIYHGFPYQQPSFAYPGFDAFSSPYLPAKLMCYASNFARVNPFWEFFPALNAYVTRCQFVLQQGRTVSNIGLYYPLFNYPDAVLQKEELVGGYLDEYDAQLARFTINGRPSKKLNGEERWTQAQVRLATSLVANGYSYVHLNPESLLRGRVEDGKLVVGSARLEALVLAHVERITVEVAAKLQAIATAGIPVLFVGRVPDKQTGFYNYRENDAIVASITAELSKRYGNVLRSDSDLPIYLADKLGVQPNLRFDGPQRTVHYIHKRTDKGDYYFLRHAAREPLTVSMRFPHVNCVPYLLDPWSGQVSPAAQYEADEDAVRMDVHFPGYGSTLAERWLIKVASRGKRCSRDAGTQRLAPSRRAARSRGHCQTGAPRFERANGLAPYPRTEVLLQQGRLLDPHNHRRALLAGRPVGDPRPGACARRSHGRGQRPRISTVAGLSLCRRCLTTPQSRRKRDQGHRDAHFAQPPDRLRQSRRQRLEAIQGPQGICAVGPHWSGAPHSKVAAGDPAFHNTASKIGAPANPYQ
jgi:hypothetical protein